MSSIFFAHNSLDLPTRVRKPSKRQQGLDPVVPLTPAPAPRTKSRPQIPTTPLPPAPSSFVSRQIHKSQNQFNRTAARVLFTPHAIRHCAPQPLDSPTPSNEQPVHSLSDNPSGSEVEAEIGTGLRRLDLAQLSSSSGSQSPRAGLPTVLSKAPSRNISLKLKGGAADVWKFFEKSQSNRHICILCK